MRPKYTEAKPAMFYITLGVSSITTIALSILVGLGKMPVPHENDLTHAIVGGATVLIGFIVAVFTMYFTYKMPEHIEDRMKRHGFYYQLPRNMIHCTVFLAVSLFIAVISYFLQDIARSIFVIIATAQFVTGIVMTVFVTVRFFMVIKAE